MLAAALLKAEVLTTLSSVMVLDSLRLQAVESAPVPLFVFIDGYRLNDPLRFRPGKIDRQQAVSQIRTQYLHPLRQHERALEMARGNAAMDVLSCFVVLLPSADDELILFSRHIQLI